MATMTKRSVVRRGVSDIMKATGASESAVYRYLLSFEDNNWDLNLRDDSGRWSLDGNVFRGACAFITRQRRAIGL